MDGHAKRVTGGTSSWLIYWGEMEISGTEFYVDGIPTAFAKLPWRVVGDNSPYMADYVPGEHGTICQVRFDRIEEN